MTSQAVELEAWREWACFGSSDPLGDVWRAIQDARRWNGVPLVLVLDEQRFYELRQHPDLVRKLRDPQSIRWLSRKEVAKVMKVPTVAVLKEPPGGCPAVLVCVGPAR